MIKPIPRDLSDNVKAMKKLLNLFRPLPVKAGVGYGFAFALALVLSLAASPSGSWAQEEGPELPPVRIAFRTLMLQGTLGGPHLHLIDGKGNRMEILVFTTNLSHKTYEYTGPNPLVFYQEQDRVASFTVPQGMSEMILLFIEKKNREPGEPKFRIAGMEADAVNFPLGSYLFINFSDLDVAAQIDKERIRLKPKEQKLVKLSYEENTSIAARFAEFRGGEWVRSYQLAWYFQPTARKMVFLTRDGDVDNSLRVRTITDRYFSPLPPEEEEEGREANRVDPGEK